MHYKIVHPSSSNPVYPAILVSTLRELLVIPCKTVRLPSSHSAFWFLEQSTLREVLVMLCTIVPPLTSNPVYLSILILDTRQGISYAMQNHSPAYQ